MTEIYLARHGQTVWNTETRMQGWSDSPLTDLGRRQALALASALTETRLEGLYTSSLGRAVETAAIIRQAQSQELSLRGEDGLREIHLGPWEGLTKAEILERHPLAARHFWQFPSLYQPENAESFTQARARLVETFHRIAAAHRGGRIAIISHGVAIRLLLTYFLDLSIDKLWETPSVHQASLSLVHDSGSVRLIFTDRREHLSGLITPVQQAI